MRNLCPRCNSETMELDKPEINVGKKKMRVSLRQCPKCKLLFHEGS